MEISMFESAKLKKMFKNVPGVGIIDDTGEIHITYGKDLIATVNPKSKYVDFSEDYRDPMHHGEALRPFMDFIEKEKYQTNLK